MTNTKQSNNQVFNGFLVDMTKIDNEDYRTLLAYDRALPLSENEKEYIDLLYQYNTGATMLLEKISSMQGKTITKKLQLELDQVVDKSKQLLNITPDIIGRGYLFTKHTEGKK